jgi:hypothetical protein
MASREAENRQVESDLRNKLKLENTFKPEIRNLFLRMSKQFSISVAKTGVAPLASTFLADWQGLLRKHYDRVQKMFTGTVRQLQGKFLENWSLKQEDEELDDEELATFAFALQEWSNERAPESAGFITDTNQKNFDDSLNEARKQLQEDEEPFDDRDLALVALALLRRKFNGRIEGIATLETQAAAEVTKLTEAEVSSGIAPSVNEPLGFVVVVATKVWRTVGDSRVRDIHRKVNGQIKLITQPFEVNGQLLRHPGDTSLGATLDNTANCRCSGIYRL